VSHLLLAAAAQFHDKSKAPFFIAAGVLVAWAVLVSVVGIRTEGFVTRGMAGRAIMGITAVLVIVTAAMAIVTAKTPPPAAPYRTNAATNGVAPAFTPVNPAPANGLALSAASSGALAYSTTTLVASSSHVTIAFTNKSPLGHNVTIADSAGKVLGSTPTFSGGTKTLSLDLPPGTYTFYCSVPGHEQAGMKGTLTVR
jgi:plastocyanin